MRRRTRLFLPFILLFVTFFLPMSDAQGDEPSPVFQLYCKHTGRRCWSSSSSNLEYLLTAAKDQSKQYRNLTNAISIEHHTLSELPVKLFGDFPSLRGLYLIDCFFAPFLNAYEDSEIRIAISRTFDNGIRIDCASRDIVTVDNKAFDVFETPVDIEYYELDLSSNWLTDIKPGTFKVIPRLKRLFLANNYLRTVHGAFANLPYLEDLDLRHNRIEIINSDNFANLVSLRTLQLGENRIESLAPDFIKTLPNLSLVSVRNNLLNSPILNLSVCAERRNSTEVMFLLDFNNFDKLKIQTDNYVTIKRFKCNTTILIEFGDDESRTYFSVMQFNRIYEVEVYPEKFSLDPAKTFFFNSKVKPDEPKELKIERRKFCLEDDVEIF